MNQESPFSKSFSIQENGFGSCDVYFMKPGGMEKKHYHDGIEVVYVLKGNCLTHKQGQTYVYQQGVVHEVINDSTEEIVLVCLTIPPESESNTHFVD